MANHLVIRLDIRPNDYGCIQCMYDMTVNMQLAVVFYHSPCCCIFAPSLFILSCIGVLRYEIKALLLLYYTF